MRRVTAKCPGSCGELIQGWIGDSQKLVSYGINSYSWATIAQGSQKLRTVNHKAWRALQKAMEHLNIPAVAAEDLSLHIYSELPVAKGMASSTADIAATCMATAAYFQKPLTMEEILAICLEIERTDSTLFSSLTLFEQEHGKTREASGWQPDFYVLVLEPEANLATEDFHSAQVEELFYQQRSRFQLVYERYQEAIWERDLNKLGQAASASALLNQEILPKPFFAELLELKETYQLLGLNVAHSGSVVGLMTAKKEQLAPLISYLRKSAVGEFYSSINVYQSCYQGVQLA